MPFRFGREKNELIKSLATNTVHDINQEKIWTLQTLHNINKDDREHCLEIVVILVCLLGGPSAAFVSKNSIIQTAGMSAATGALAAVIQRRATIDGAKVAAKEVLDEYERKNRQR